MSVTAALVAAVAREETQHKGRLTARSEFKMASSKSFDDHTAVVEEAMQKMLYIVADLGLMGRPVGRKAAKLPKSEVELLEAIASCKAMSARSRAKVRASIVALTEAKAMRDAASDATRLQADAVCAIIYASQTREDLDHGLRLIEKLFPGQPAADAVPVVKAMIKSGEGRIYGTKQEPLLAPGRRRNLPHAVYRARKTLIVDAAAAAGAVAHGQVDPKKSPLPPSPLRSWPQSRRSWRISSQRTYRCFRAGRDRTTRTRPPLKRAGDRFALRGRTASVHRCRSPHARWPHRDSLTPVQSGTGAANEAALTVESRSLVAARYLA